MRLTVNQDVAGSNPARGATFVCSFCLGVAQPGSVLASEVRCRWFESSRLDRMNKDIQVFVWSGYSTAW